MTRNGVNARPLLVVFATLDPRGNKIGGIETHIRHILRNHPAETDLLLVGIDEFGDLPLGQPQAVDFAGRAITFLPVAYVPADEARVSASRLMRSTTLRFVAGGLRHLLALRRLVAGRAVSADLPRVEFSILPALLRVPFVLTVHADLAKASVTDSLLKRYGAAKRWSEALAFATARHVFTVNEGIQAALVAAHPGLAGKSGVLPVPVDTGIFTPAPFPATDTFRLVYAGRFDEVKDPALMFETVAALARKLDNRVEFHVIGSASPDAFPEFAAIRHLTTLHGPRDAEGVAARIRAAHCGIMTSHTEGLPCFLLETLASGRAFTAVRLPTFEAHVVPGVTGQLVERGTSRAETATRLADSLARVWLDIRAGVLKPEVIAATISGLSVTAIFARLFEVHAAIRRGPKSAAPAAPEVARSRDPASLKSAPLTPRG
ncbi:MAG: hypothetical protein FD175_2133 [Beijerinckiaceae bacterium]|nr:MAG: hypothetical protein FD175_2133 [Beijerinckiaceae bacterium]